MKSILYIIAILLAGGAAFFSIKQSGKFKEAQQTRLETIAEHKQVASAADATEKQLKDLKSSLVAADAKKEEITQKLDALKSAGATIERDVGGLDNTLKNQEGDFEELNKTKDELSRIMSDLGGDVNIETLGDKIKEFDESKKTQETKLEELETLTTAAEKLLATNRDRKSVV
jgi:chromosome segregation ATPase